MQKNLSPISLVLDANTPSGFLLPFQPAHVQRKVAARWQVWAPWVRLLVLRCDYAALMDAETARMRQQHSQHLLCLLYVGISMRVIHRHRLDDPRITDEARAVLMRAAMERRRTARLARRRTSRNAQGSTTRPREAANRDSPRDLEPSTIAWAPRHISPVQDKRVTIDLIQKRVSEHFYLRELRDQDLKVRSNRRIFTFPRQLAMYIVRHCTTASLPEIGRQFGGMHHTTVLHSINKIEEMRRLDEQLNYTITRLMDVSQEQPSF
jgi:hypothetical protein